MEIYIRLGKKIKASYFDVWFHGDNKVIFHADTPTVESVLNMQYYSYYKARGMFYIPSDSGNRSAIFLSTCSTYRSAKPVQDYLNKFNLKVIGSN